MTPGVRRPALTISSSDDECHERLDLPATSATRFGNSRSGSPRKEKHLQRGEQCLEIVLGLINGWGCGAALEQEVNRFPRRAGGVFDSERHIPRSLHVLADESEIGRALR